MVQRNTVLPQWLRHTSGPIFGGDLEMDPTTMNEGPAIRKERTLAVAAVLPGLAVLVLWCVYATDMVYGLDLYRYGIFPRTVHGLLGILLSPFIHGDVEHLLNNSIPLFVLGWALMHFFPQVALRVTLGSWLVSGVWVWLSARGSYHIGASGVVYGLAAFLFVSGLLRQQRTLMGLSLLVVFLYGGMLWGVFPIVPRISWESHFWGAAAGLAMAFLYRSIPAAVQAPPPIDWGEDGSEEEAEAVSAYRPEAAPDAAPDANDHPESREGTSPNEAR